MMTQAIRPTHKGKFSNQSRWLADRCQVGPMLEEMPFGGRGTSG
jgi:hypothetical protein